MHEYSHTRCWMRRRKRFFEISRMKNVCLLFDFCHICSTSSFSSPWAPLSSTHPHTMRILIEEIHTAFAEDDKWIPSNWCTRTDKHIFSFMKFVSKSHLLTSLEKSFCQYIIFNILVFVYLCDIIHDWNVMAFLPWYWIFGTMKISKWEPKEQHSNWWKVTHLIIIIIIRRTIYKKKSCLRLQSIEGRARAVSSEVLDSLHQKPLFLSYILRILNYMDVCLL